MPGGRLNPGWRKGLENNGESRVGMKMGMIFEGQQCENNRASLSVAAALFGIDTLDRPFLKESGLGYRSEDCTHGLIRTDRYVMCTQKRNVMICDKHETMKRKPLELAANPLKCSTLNNSQQSPFAVKCQHRRYR